MRNISNDWFNRGGHPNWTLVDGDQADVNLPFSSTMTETQEGDGGPVDRQNQGRSIKVTQKINEK